MAAENLAWYGPMLAPGDAWSCPMCGSINVVRGEFCAAGFCQAAPCIMRRGVLRRGGMTLYPELLAALDTKPFAAAAS